jgi:hypothetical protein
MAITVKHKFVSAIPDAGDPTIVQPSNWNDDHQLTGTIPVDNGGTGAATLTGYVKGNGTSPMTASATVPSTDITGLGTMSAQNANNVSVTGGTVSGTTLTSDTVSNNLTFTPTSAPSYVEGELWYDSTQKSLAYYNDITNNTLHIGQEVQLKVINNTGSTINIGQPVYVTGTSSGQTYPNVALAIANTLTTANVIGLANQNIASGSAGYVTTIGLIQGINTGSYTVGDTLYLSPYSAGYYQNTIPPTGYAVKLGTVAYVNSSNGAIYINKSNLSVQAGNIVGTVAVANGGTGQATASAAFNALSPLTTAGDVLYGGTSGAGTRLAIGTAGQVLTVNSGATAPQWSTPTTGTVTSVAALTLGTTGTDLTSTVATGTTTPVITLNVPTASATNRGALSSADWTTFNNKGSGTVTSIVAGTGLSGGTITGSGTIAIDSTVATLSGTQTFTNKRINLRVQSQTSTATLAINSDNYDQSVLTAQAVSLSVSAPTGTPVNGQKLTIRIKDNATPQSISWTTTSGGFRIVGTTLPTTTVASKVVYIGAVYNSDETFWDVVSVAQQA